MARKKKKRQHSRTVELKRQMEQEMLAEERDRAKKRMNPVARTLLLIDLVFLAVVFNARDFSALLIALWLQFGPKRRGSGGPKL